ncbi:hypothetical protein KJ853_03615 [Patescibacteria group bacterium]|nr:hypothetical protein [Patescibacteria group bacterium]
MKKQKSWQDVLKKPEKIGAKEQTAGLLLNNNSFAVVGSSKPWYRKESIAAGIDGRPLSREPDSLSRQAKTFDSRLTFRTAHVMRPLRR